MRALEELDRWIAGKIKDWSSRVSGEPHGRELLEIRRNILERARAEIKPLGAGRNVFPFNRISIRVPCPDERERAAFESALVGPDGIERDLRDLLNEARCAAPPGWQVDVAVSGSESSQMNFDVAFSHVSVEPKAEAQIAARRPDALVRVLSGSTESSVELFPLKSDRVNIGRLKEVVGSRDGLRRRNDIAFAETETAVSREHAVIRYDPDSGWYRIYDSGSQRGTSLFRDGRRLEVPRGTTHGLQLKSGDEIHLGTARLLFEITEPADYQRPIS